MNVDQEFDLEVEKAKLERAAEKHDWAGEILDDVIEGLASPFEHDHSREDDEPRDPDHQREDEEREKREVEERLNEVW